MAGRLAALVRRLRRGAALDQGGGSDADLLARFVTARDESAFELLVWRHGAMVLAACRRVLGHTEDAEDAFQATFLVLARKAHTVHLGTAVPAWLHRVAVRIARRAAAVRRPTVSLGTEPPDRVPPDAAEQRELRGLLDAEIDRLSEPYRQAFVLCYLEGLSNAEAARELGCPVGTVESRLTAARRALRGRLARRLQLPAGALAALGCYPVLSAEAVAAVKRAGAVAATRGLRAAIGIVSEPAVRLAERALTMTKTQKWLAGTLGAALFGLAAGVGWAYSTTEPLHPPETTTAPTGAPPTAAPAEPVVAPPPKLAKPAPKDAWPLVRTLQLHGSELIGVTPDGKSLLTKDGSSIGAVSLTSKDRQGVAYSQNGIRAVAISSDGQFVATAEGANGVKLRDAAGRIVEALWPTGDLPAQQVAFTPDGAKLIVLCERGEDWPPGKEPNKGSNPWAKGASSPVSAKRVTRMSVWDVATRKELSSFDAADKSTKPPAVTLAGHGQFALRIQVVTEATAEGPQTVKGRRFNVTHAVTGSVGKPLEVAGATLGPAHPDPLSPDGKTLALLDPTKNQLRLLAADTGKDRFHIPAFRRPVKAVAFSPDGRFVAAATGTAGHLKGPGSSRDDIAAPSEVVIWDAFTGKEVARLVDKESIHDYSALAFSSDGSFLAAQTSARGFSLVKLWGRLPAPEPTVEPAVPAKPIAKGAPVAPDRFQTLFRELSAEAVTDGRRVEVLFLAALGRFPTDVEARTLAAQLARRNDKADALRELLGTLAETAEFRAHAAELQRMVK